MGIADDWRAWRADREERLRDPHGWLSITAIHWLTEEPQRFADVPGEWRQDERGPVLDGRPLGAVDAEGLTLTFGDVVAGHRLRGDRGRCAAYLHHQLGQRVGRHALRGLRG